ncbi:MAG: DUF1289 domain-containing protein [Rhodobiaceae bacterium]|nr:DUF1289 domain-containing protein [Rhodobiaceae bacterium]MCC0012778.1 DUF1289 domain-containing protein [Rhodobiaceae bacterium]MCC0018337.1 DUF1289 domain-containing protein [Rhodobiaceae bacterium]MCC0051130.1 DUF1289 domain-containing protein [Rhodobiaceae bacterium]MCC0060195.1 DUF1289 domain-containing protein [Rhodobiaceae bacterium]
MSAFQGRRFPGPPSAEAVETPCIGICNMDRTRGICRGCGRTIDEIAGWTQMSAAERARIMSALPERLRTGGIEP